MNGNSSKLTRWFLPMGSLVFGVSLIATPIVWHQETRQAARDNTRTNADPAGPTADQRKMSASDRAITQEIRKAIHHDKSLSPYGQNIKIFMRDGKVTLRGPVRSEEEKSKLEANAADAAGQANVTNQLEVAPAK